jgi:hypothetical protein
MTETTSQISPVKPAVASSVISYRTKMMYRRRGFSNLLKMGHCAPAVMQTILDLGNTKEEWLVRMTAGLPGGICKRMSNWFTKEFGSTLCREVTQCDFSSLGNVYRYIEKDSVTTCKIIAEKVARQAERIIKQKGVGF